MFVACPNFMILLSTQNVLWRLIRMPLSDDNNAITPILSHQLVSHLHFLFLPHKANSVDLLVQVKYVCLHKSYVSLILQTDILIT